MNAKSVGIFDSGVGGLTVAGEFARTLPHERIVYLGDTARVPYGSKSPEVIKRYAERCADFLVSQDIKLLIVACNTASAFALEHLQARLTIPVIGVIEPGARAAVAASKRKHIGVIGTTGTIASGAYARAIRALDPGIMVEERACPLFVPLAEEGWTTHAATELVAETYLADLKRTSLDCLVLGCTHYPVLRDVIQKVVGAHVKLVDSATAVTQQAQRTLAERNGLSDAETAPAHRFYLTDAQRSFEKTAERFFGARVSTAMHVDL